MEDRRLHRSLNSEEEAISAAGWTGQHSPRLGERNPLCLMRLAIKFVKVNTGHFGFRLEGWVAVQTATLRY
jgi:hypothetical protein